MKKYASNFGRADGIGISDFNESKTAHTVQYFYLLLKYMKSVPNRLLSEVGLLPAMLGFGK